MRRITDIQYHYSRILKIARFIRKILRFKKMNISIMKWWYSKFEMVDTYAVLTDKIHKLIVYIYYFVIYLRKKE